MTAGDRTSAAKVGDWLRRYGIAECGGISCALVASLAVQRVTHSAIATGYAGAWGESIGYASIIIGRDFVSARRAARRAGHGLGVRGSQTVATDLILEFGPAGLLDTFITRPFMMALGTRLFGPVRGIIAGKLSADVLFYVPVIFMYERRKARSE